MKSEAMEIWEWELQLCGTESEMRCALVATQIQYAMGNCTAHELKCAELNWKAAFLHERAKPKA